MKDFNKFSTQWEKYVIPGLGKGVMAIKTFAMRHNVLFQLLHN